MRLKIEDFCIRCGICVHFYPELFEMDYNEDVVRVKVDEVPRALETKAKDSVRDCAVTAIHMEK